MAMKICHAKLFPYFCIMINIAIFASGTGSNAVNLIQYYSGSTEIKIKLIVSNKEDAGIVKKAEDLRKSVQLISKDTLGKYLPSFIDFLKSEQVDLIVLAGFLLKIPEDLIRAFPNRIVNLHPSLLPAYGGKGMYGLNVHRAVLANKETKSGITVHYVNEEYDKGEIILQASCEVFPTDTPEILGERVHQLEYTHFPLAVDQVIERYKNGQLAEKK